MEDTGQGGVSSPATPGTSKSKLDTLPKEELIKIVKKQLIFVQKAKSKCTDLEKEIENLKSKPVKEETDDVVQALTERLDAVLLEKAENHQQLISLKKEYAKTKEEAESAIKKATEVQNSMESSNTALLQEMEKLKNELVQTQNNHKTDVDTVKKELHDALVKQRELTDILSLQENKDIQLNKLKEELQNVHVTYDEKIASLEKALEISVEDNNRLTLSLKDLQAASEHYNNENQHLRAETLKLQSLHQDEFANLSQQLEKSTKQGEQEKIVLQDLIKQYVEKEKLLQEEIRANSQKNAEEIEILKKKLEENFNVPEIQHSATISNDNDNNDNTQRLEKLVTDLESQQSLLKDELTYTNNLKIRLEREVANLKSEYFHEKDELEFKINELQLAIEDYNGLIEKLQTELRSTKLEHRQISQQRAEDIKRMREQHNRDIEEMKRSLMEHSEGEQMSLKHEIHLLKEQVDKISQEKEEAVNNYESLRETFLSLQAELGESAGKISREFEAMKQQQATDVGDLQQKLRSAYKDKNNILETMNQLKSEVELLSTKQEECEELQLKITQLQQINEEVIASLQQKEHLLKELQSKMSKTAAENTEISSTLKGSLGELKKLQEIYECEQDRVNTLQQEAETYTAHNEQLKKMVDDLTQKLQESSLPPAQSESQDLQLTQLQKTNDEVVALLHEKETSFKDLQLKMEELTIQNAELSSSLENSKKEILDLKESWKSEETKTLNFQHKAEEHEKLNAQLTQLVEELTQQLKELSVKSDQSEVVALLHEKETSLKDLQLKMEELTTQNAELSSGLENSRKEILDLKESWESEETKTLNFQHKAEEHEKLNAQLTQSVEELTQQLKELSVKSDQSEVVALLNVKETSLKDLQLKMEELTTQNAELSNSLENSRKEILDLKESWKSEETKTLNFQHKSEEHEKLNAQLTQSVEELTQQLKELSVKSDQSEVVALLHEKETSLKNFQLKMEELTTQNVELSNSLENSRKEILDLKESWKSEETKMLNFQHKAEEHEKLNAQLRQSVEELTQQLKELSVNNDQNLTGIKNLQQQVDMLIVNKEKLETDARRLQDESSRLQEEKEVISRDLARLVCEHSGCETLKDDMDNLRIKFQMASEGKDKIAILLEQKERYVGELKTELGVVQDLLTVECIDPDIGVVFQSIIKAILQLKEEKENAVLQKEETSVQLIRLQEELEAQCSELRALLSDYSKEKVLLKENLEETIADKEALQRDLFEMKNALEKLKLENQELLQNIENVTSLQNAAEYKTGIQGELTVTENKETSVCVQEVNSVQEITLKSEAMKLEHDTVVLDLQKKIENLMKECKEREEKSNKIKAVAVKAKKELDANKKEVQSLRKELERAKAEKDQITFSMRDLVQGAESYQNLMVEYDKQMELLETEKERGSSKEHQLEELTRQLRAAYVEHEKLNSINEDLLTRMETLQSNNRLIEAQILELQRAKGALDKDFEAEKLIKEQKIKDYNGAVKQIEELQQQLQKEKKQLQKYTQELELVRKDAQKSTLMDMEMADYERLVKELNQRLTHKSSQLEDLEQEISIQKQKQETLQQEIFTLQTTVEQHEERSTKMKQLLVKTKKELADSKQAESDQFIIQASLKGELEASQQHVEAYKIQVAELTSEKHKVQEQLRALTEQHQRAVNSFQQKVLVLQEECTAAKAEQAAVTAEFESYKVRVHNVLKQQKNKSASQAEHEAFKQEREHLQTMLDQVKSRLQEAQHSLHNNTAELQTLQSEHDMLLERHNKMLQETVTKEAELREKLCTVQSENMVLKTEHAQVVSQLSAQNELQRNSFRDQVRRLQDDHRKTVETLQQQLSKVEAQLFQVKSDNTVTSTTGSQQPVKSLRERRPADLPMLDLYSVAREEGEGMETTDTDSVSSANTQIASLEQLLSSSDIKAAIDQPQWQPEISREELTEKLNTSSKSVDHLSGLLHETEATNAILMEQITLLKNEIRRLERNQEREKSVANLEYLKNVLLQFIFLKAGSERQRLLPVIDTMLQLSPDEKGKLYAIAQGEEESASRPAGWSSYLHSWSGLR